MLVFTVALLAAAVTAQPALDAPVLNPAPQGRLCPETAMSLAGKMGTRPPHAIPLSKLPRGEIYMAVDRRIDNCPAPMTMTEYRNPHRR
jgi:hypothetical protein